MQHVGLTRKQVHMWKHIVDCVREIPCFTNVTVDVNPWFTWEPVDVGTDIDIEEDGANGFEFRMSAAGDGV